MCATNRLDRFPAVITRHNITHKTRRNASFTLANIARGYCTAANLLARYCTVHFCAIFMPKILHFCRKYFVCFLPKYFTQMIYSNSVGLVAQSRCHNSQRGVSCHLYTNIMTCRENNVTQWILWRCVQVLFSLMYTFLGENPPNR